MPLCIKGSVLFEITRKRFPKQNRLTITYRLKTLQFLFSVIEHKAVVLKLLKDSEYFYSNAIMRVGKQNISFNQWEFLLLFPNYCVIFDHFFYVLKKNLGKMLSVYRV